MECARNWFKIVSNGGLSITYVEPKASGYYYCCHESETNSKTGHLMDPLSIPQ